MANAGYANARAKYLENNLLGEDRLYRMIESDSPEDALKILSEVNFGEGVLIISPLEFEKLIDAESSKLLKFIEETNASFALASVLRAKTDFHNAEALMRSKHLKIDVTQMLSKNGSIDVNELKEKINVDDYRSFSENLANALKLCDEEFVTGKATGRKINAIFSKALYKEINNLSKKDKILKDVYSVKADCANIGIALRSRNYALASEMFVEGGKLGNDILKKLCEDPLEELKEKCKYSDLSFYILKGIDCTIKGEPLSEFEKVSDGYAISYLERNKYSAEGLHPFMQYVFYKLSELKNVRIVMVGLINGIDKNEIKKRLRKGYEG